MDKVTLPRIKKSEPLDPKQFRAFLKFLPPLIGLLAETYKFACEAYAQIGLLYYWEELFQLPANAVCNSEYGPHQIHLFRYSSYGTNGELFFAHFLPDDLAEKLLKLSRANHEGLLFQQEDGSPFNHARIVKEFQKASEKAFKVRSIKMPVTPMTLRTTPPAGIKFRPGILRVVTEEKMDEVKKILSRSYRNAGRPREKSLKEILEVLLEQEFFGYSRKELVRLFPVARAAESQKRQWKKRGIWQEILQLFQS